MNHLLPSLPHPTTLSRRQGKIQERNYIKSKCLVPIFGPALACLPGPSVNEMLKHASELASIRSTKAPRGNNRGKGQCMILHHPVGLQGGTGVVGKKLEWCSEEQIMPKIIRTRRIIFPSAQ